MVQPSVPGVRFSPPSGMELTRFITTLSGMAVLSLLPRIACGHSLAGIRNCVKGTAIPAEEPGSVDAQVTIGCHFSSNTNAKKSWAVLDLNQ